MKKKRIDSFLTRNDFQMTDTKGVSIANLLQQLWQISLRWLKSASVRVAIMSHNDFLTSQLIQL